MICMQMLEIMVQHESAGGWILEKPHIEVLIDKYSASEDFLQLLIEEQIAQSSKAKDHEICRQLAVMLSFTRQALEHAQWSYNLDWLLALSNLTGRTTVTSPSNVYLPGGRQSGIIRQSLCRIFPARLSIFILLHLMAKGEKVNESFACAAEIC